MFEGRVLRVAADVSRDPQTGASWYTIEVATGEPIRPEADLEISSWAAAAWDTIAGRSPDIPGRRDSANELVPQRWPVASSSEPDGVARDRSSTGVAARDAAAAVSVPGREFALAPGIPAEVHIRTDERSPLSYFTKPLTDYFSRSLREE